MSHAFKVKHLGQVFTPDNIVQKMISLSRNRGSILEPSCGNGAFLKRMNKAIGIEIDKDIITDKSVLKIDFFSYSKNNKFDTIIGNPPYVRFQDIPIKTKNLLPMDLFDRRSNFYLFFIAKCIDHLNDKGELIFITPRDFLKSTNSKNLNKKLYDQGSFTDFYELGDDRVFNGYSPNCAIWRWEKGLKDRKMSCRDNFCFLNGQIWFGKEAPKSNLSDYFNVKVGAVSGADYIFSNKKHGNIKMVCSHTNKTGEIRTMIYNKKCGYLNQFKAKLLNRRIREFNQSNWWKWGREYHDQDGERIYVNCKTRNSKPFFISEEKAYDGSVLALFPKMNMNLSKVVDKLNKVKWRDFGFVCDGRLIFSQRSLQNAPISNL